TVARGVVLQNADLLLRDGHVKAIGRELPVPPDAVVIEAEGRPVTPGFFAGISRLGLVEITLEEPGVAHNQPPPADLRPEFDVTPNYDPLSSAIPVTRIEGYTWTVLEAARAGSLIGGQGRAAWLDGAYGAFAGENILFINLGDDAAAQTATPSAAHWMLLEQAMAEAATEAQWLPQPLLTLAGRQALAPYRSSALTVFDVNGAADILQVLRFSAQHGLRPVISGGAEAWMVANRLAEAGVPVVLDPLGNLPASFDQIGARMDNAALLHAAGVTIAFGGAGVHNARKLRQAAGNAVAHGLPYEAALAALTVNPAMIFELGPLHGTLEEGSRGDLVMWSGDPLEVTSVAEQVVIAGRPIPMVSRQTLLRDRYLERNPALPRAYIKPGSTL
ncbi:MAG: amidohydrolase family protein, partial [Xanthomonadales bacterium]|nr:amidohydrolase family protein [Xanthomonadales bacterium]